MRSGSSDSRQHRSAASEKKPLVVTQKFRRNTSGVLADDHTDRLLETVMRIEHASVADLARLLAFGDR